MPLEREADALAKALSPFLGVDFPFEELRSRGWFDFLRYDRPLTDDPIEMACSAFLYLFAGDDYDTRLHALKRVVAFICGKTGRGMLDAHSIQRAAALLKPATLDEAAIRAWFTNDCR